MSDSVTISLLPVSLSVIHIPRSRLPKLCHPILRQILLPNPTFLNITCNELELSLFAEHHVIEDFKAIARKDARKRKVRGRDRLVATPDNKRRKSTHDWDSVEISSERWNVLQIDSHSSALDNSGARIHELSAPIAAAGISILYQSSYMSDFIFVKQHRLSEVMSLLASSGFDLYSSDPQNLTFASPILPPLTSVIDDISSIHLLDLSGPVSSISSESGAILTRSRSSTDATFSSGSSLSNSRMAAAHEDHSSDENIQSPIEIKPLGSRSQSHSPSACDVSVLSPELTCIGLSDENADMWSIKIIKLVQFPELIEGQQRYSHSASEDRSSLASNPAVIHETPDESVDGSNQWSESESSESNGCRSDDTTRIGQASPKDPSSRYSSESPIFDLEHRKPWDEVDEEGKDELDGEEESSSEDGYFSASPNQATGEEELKARLDEDNVGDDAVRRNVQNGADTGTRIQRPTLPHLQTLDTIIPSSIGNSKGNISHSPESMRSRSSSSASFDSDIHDYTLPDTAISFFSFTRTPEGSSLTAPVSTLAALFPQSERHMVICSGELDILDSRANSPTHSSDESDSEDDNDDSKSGFDTEPQGTLKCLQIDLRKFGLGALPPLDNFYFN
ncbi:hypothetical protein C8Q75DRAFT_802592 [Abortiporus biennis]|nr:hypothetical protein C8Q75DRAFT_802592 [Abortiporus biennis]